MISYSVTKDTKKEFLHNQHIEHKNSKLDFRFLTALRPDSTK